MHAAHPTPLVIGDETYAVRRDFDLIVRLEAAFGPLAEIEARLRKCFVKADDLVAMARVALKAQSDPPETETIRHHLADVGVREMSDQLAILILHLFNGHKRTIAWLQAEAEKASGGEDAEPHPPNPA